jgi:hypothetical protein
VSEDVVASDLLLHADAGPLASQASFDQPFSLDG